VKGEGRRAKRRQKKEKASILQFPGKRLLLSRAGSHFSTRLRGTDRRGRHACYVIFPVRTKGGKEETETKGKKEENWPSRRKLIGLRVKKDENPILRNKPRQGQENCGEIIIGALTFFCDQKMSHDVRPGGRDERQQVGYTVGSWREGQRNRTKVQLKGRKDSEDERSLVGRR